MLLIASLTACLDSTYHTSLLNELDLPECQKKLVLNVFRLMIFERYSSQISGCSCCPFDLASIHFLFTSFPPDIGCH